MKRFLAVLTCVLGLAQIAAAQTTTIRATDPATGADVQAVGDAANDAIRVSQAGSWLVSGIVAVSQSGTWTVQPGNTANTTAWLVTGTGGTFPATQSGTWNLTNISGTISLPTGAATASNQTGGSQKTQIVDGSGNVIGATSNALDVNIKSGNPSTITVTQGTGTNLHAVVDSGAVTVSQGTATNLKTQAENYQGGSAVSGSNPLQVTLANTGANATAVKVDNSAVTQPVNGTVSAAQPTLTTTSATWTNATPAATQLSLSTTSLSTVTVSIVKTGSISGGLLTFAVGDANAVAFGMPGTNLASATSAITFDPTGASSAYRFNVAGWTSFIVALNPQLTGTGSIVVTIAGSTGPEGAQVLARQATASDLQVTATQSGTYAVTQSGTWSGLRVVGNSGTSLDGTTAGIVDHYARVGTSANLALTSSTKTTLTTSVNVKASAGNVYGVFAMNGAASTCWIQFLNSSGTGTLGTAVILSIPLPASTTQPVWITPAPFALANFSTGIAVGIATTATGNSACGTGGNVDVFYN